MDPNTVFQLQTLKWSRPQSQTFTAVIGLGLLIGGKLTKKSIAKLGEHGHTTASMLTDNPSGALFERCPIRERVSQPSEWRRSCPTPRPPKL